MVFCQVFASLQETLQSEEGNSSKTIKNIKDLAHQLFNNVSSFLCSQIYSVPDSCCGVQWNLLFMTTCHLWPECMVAIQILYFDTFKITCLLPPN